MSYFGIKNNTKKYCWLKVFFCYLCYFVCSKFFQKMAHLDKERNAYILKRLMLLQSMEAPTISDVKKNFGDDFAEKLFCNCDPNFREDFGLEPPLKGPIGGDLWTSPSDLLIGKVCLKPPLTSKHIRALTHQGIMDIGLRIEKLFWNQVEIEKSKELEEQDRTLKLLCETSKRESIAEVQSKMMEIFKRQRLELINEMDELCKEEMKRMEVKYYLDLKDELKEQARELEQQFQLKIEEEVTKTSEVMTVQSSANLEELESSMKKAFQAQLHKAEILARFEIQKEQTKTKEKLSALHHDLECKNLANMMYLICMERKKCTFEKMATENQLTQEIRELSDILRNKEEEMAKMKDEREKHKREVELREKALLEVIREFQKFINFALKSVPKQAEYLLCAEKLMVFELADALSKVEVPQDDDHDRNYLWDRTPEPADSSEGSLKVKDGHDCLNQPEISESELSVGQFLPGFYYNDQLFVREDFRNMISQGITINENNMLWTKHVQDVINHLEKPCQSCVFNDKKENNNKPMERRRSIVSYQSSVHFHMKDKETKSLMSVDKDKRYRRASLKPIEPEEILQTIDFRNIGSEENRKTLISARNSLEVIKETNVRRRSSIKSEDIMKQKQPEEQVMHTVEDLTLEKEIKPPATASKLNLDTRDSIIRTKVHQAIANEVKASKESAGYSNSGRRPSKIMMTHDSLEVLKRRESIVASKKPQDNECVLQSCNAVQDNTSSEEIVTKISEELKRNEMEYESEPPRRMSIAFTGRSIIYEKKDGGEFVNEQEIETSKIQKTRKKYKNIKSYKSKKKGEQEPGIQTSGQTTENEEIYKNKKIETPRKIIIGDSNMKFFNQSEEQFTSDRIRSFVNILKDHPDLIRLFTSVTR